MNIALSLISLALFSPPYYWRNVNSFISEQDMFEYLRDYKLVSTYLYSSKFNITRHKRNSQECMYFNLTLNYSLHIFCVLTNNVQNSLTKNNTTVYVYGRSKFDTKTYNLKDFSITKAEGFDIVYPSIFLFGFVIENCFFGRILTGEKSYCLEHIASFPNILKHFSYNESIGINFTAILYEENYLNVSSKYLIFGVNQNVEEWTVVPAPYKRVYSQRFMGKQKKTASGRICTVMLHADHTFLQTIAFGNIKTAINFMLHALDQADVIFRNTDFDEDGYPDNIGFRVKYIIILTTEQSPITDLKLPEKEIIDGQMYLRLLSTYHVLDDVCIGVGFTSRVFKEKAIGISYTARDMENLEPYPGGICERSLRGIHFNVLSVTMFSAPNVRVPVAMTTLALAHELGHSFGSPHDDEYSTECSRHLMSKTSHPGLKRWQYIFSSCSRRKITEALRTKGFCLEKTEEEFCGNGLIEHGEDCDCGLPFDCFERDPCCLPRGAHEDSCRVNRSAGYSCHPSQGFCCMPNCQLRNLEYLGLDCSAEKNSCPCSKKNSCDCGLFGSCLGDVCHGTECTRIGLRECPCTEAGRQCITCCHDPLDGSCVSSLNLTRRLFQRKNVSFPLLQRYANIPPKYVDKYTFMIDRYCFREKCINVAFRMWKDDEFCVIFGQLGHCLSGICDLKISKDLELRSIDTNNIAKLPFPESLIVLFPLFMGVVYHFGLLYLLDFITFRTMCLLV